MKEKEEEFERPDRPVPFYAPKKPVKINQHGGEIWYQ